LLGADGRLNDILLVRKVRLAPGQNSRQKKAPLGERGIRVIVVVANSVSVSAYGLWWIIIILVTALFIIIVVVYSYSYLIRFFWLRCPKSRFRIALHHRNLFVRTNI
jgi:hypothetical protein